LKGTNAKSTDSLSISAITNLKERTEIPKHSTETTEIKELKTPNQHFSSMERMKQSNTQLHQT
jgi:hypothetical protein